jgi:3-hydroxypropanoate dehydrogenase
MIDDHALDVLFRKARTQNGWTDKPVADEQLRRIYELMKFGPTSGNTQPARILFLRSTRAKERLKPALSPGNLDKTMAAPVCAVLAYDTHFYEHLARLFPHNPKAGDRYSGEDKKTIAEATAFRNGTLQGAYFIIAARAVGLECGPMSGFANDKVDAEFFAGTTCKTNFLCNVGYGDASKVMPRLPRLEFDEACKLL